MKNLNKKGITMVEIIIASVFFVVIFSGLFAGIGVISNYVKESNIKLNSISIAKSGIERLDSYKTNIFYTNSGDKWGKFIGNFDVGYYSFSGSETNPIKLNEDDIVDYKKWEGPLDERGYKKSGTGGISFYRLIMLSNFDTISLDKSSIFDCNIKNDTCKNGVLKNLLSNPYLSGAYLNGNNLDLTFSTGNIFNKKSIFINYIGNGSGSMNTNFSNFSTGNIDKIGDVMYIDLSYLSNTGQLSGKTITLSGTTFNFGVNLDIGNSIDKGIYNLKNSINTTLEDYSSYIFYPNSCNLKDLFILNNITGNTKYSFNLDNSNDCSDTLVNASGSLLSLSGSFVGTIKNSTINPLYKFKIDMGNTTNDYTLFSKLNSPRTTTYGVNVSNGKGYSSVYLLGTRVLGVENGTIISDEVFQTYISDI